CELAGTAERDGALLPLWSGNARGAPGPGPCRRRLDVPGHQAARPPPRGAAGRPRSSRGHGGSPLPAPLPGQLPAPAPPLRLAPLRRASRRTGRLRRGPPPADGSRRGGDGVIGARPDGFPPDGLRRDRVMGLPLTARAAKANHYYGVLLS